MKKQLPNKRMKQLQLCCKYNKRIEKENAAEDMLKAKGFSEVYVRIDDDTVDVVVE